MMDCVPCVKLGVGINFFILDPIELMQAQYFGIKAVRQIPENLLIVCAKIARRISENLFV